jgi:KDO2-lipid IV(A) lauroyltransferase
LDKVIIGIIRLIPPKVRRFFALLTARMSYHISLKHRLITLHNLTRSFPEKSTTEIKHLAKKSFESFFRLVADYFVIPGLTKKNLHQWVKIDGMEHYLNACKEDKGVLMFGGHLGNWEIGNAALAISIKPFIFVYRVFDSPLVEKGITRIRASCGNVSLSKERAMRPMIRLLKKGFSIYLLIDQNVDWREGVFVDFFGRDACTTSGLALLASHTKAPVLPAFTRLLPDGTYLMEIGPKVDIVNTGNRDKDVLTNTQLFTKIIENYIRQYPEQWFWMHQRWKTKRCQVRQKGTES